MAGRERELTIALKARDEYSAELKKAKTELTGLAAAQAKTAARRDFLSNARQEVENLSGAYQRASTDAQRYAQAMVKNADADRLSAAEQRELRDAFSLTRDRARQLKSALAEKTAELNRARGSAGSTYAAFIRNADANQKEAMSARQAAAAEQARTATLAKLESQLAALNAEAAKPQRVASTGAGQRDALAAVVNAKRDLADAQTQAQGYAAALRDAAAAGGLTEQETKDLEAAFQRARDTVRASKVAVIEKRSALDALRASQRESVTASQREADAAQAATLAEQQRAAAIDNLKSKIASLKALGPVGGSTQGGDPQITALRGVVDARENLARAQDQAQGYARAIRDAGTAGLLTEKELATLNAEFAKSRERVNAAKAALLEKRQELGRVRTAEIEAADATQRSTVAEQQRAAALAQLETRLASVQSKFASNAALSARASFEPTGNARKDALLGVVSAKAEYEAAQKSAQSYAIAVKEAGKAGVLTDAQLEALNAEFTEARVRVNAAEAALNESRVALQRLRQETVESTAATNAQAAAHGRATSQLGRYAAANRNAAASQGPDFASRTADAYATRQGRGPLGLRPYEITNLGYQVNDVVSGLAMGQAPMQIFAQQAGQIIQIFPKMGAAILRFSPYIAMLAPFAAALYRIGQEAEVLRNLERDLTLTGDAALYSADRLAKLTLETARAGVAMKDAEAAVRAFVAADIPEGKIAALVNMSRQLAKVTGEELPAAAEKLGEAFSGGVDGVRELDTELNFLSAAQYELIRSLEASGNETQAMVVAQDALADRLDETSEKAGNGGAWSQAFTNLGVVWNELIEYLRDTIVVKGAAGALRELGEAAEAATGLAAAALEAVNNGREFPELKVELAGISDEDLDRQIAQAKQMLRAAQTELDNSIRLNPWIDTSALEATIAQLDQELGELERLRAIPQDERSLAPDMEDQRAVAAEIQAIAEETLEALDRQAEQSERRKKFETDIKDLVGDQLKDVAEDQRLAAMTARERSIEEGILKLRNEAMERANELGIQFLGLSESATAELRKQLGILYDMQNSKPVAGAEFSSLWDWFVKEEELRTEAYRDQGGVLTIGVGHTNAAGGYQIKGDGDTITEEQAREIFRQDIAMFAGRVDEAVKVPITEAMRTALISYDYNTGAIVGSQIVKLLNSGDYAGAQQALANGIATVKGQPSEGLRNRRRREAELFGSQGLTSDEIAEAAGRREVELAEERAEEEEKRAEKAAEFHAQQQATLEDAQLENSLVDESLVNREVALAIREAEREAQRAGTELTAEERAQIEAVTREKFKQKSLDAERNEKLKEAKRLEEQVSMLREKAEFLRKQGEQAMAVGDQQGALQAAEELNQVNAALDQAIQKAIAFWQALGGEGAEAAIQKLQIARAEIGQVEQKTVATAEQINSMIAGAATSAFDRFSKRVAEGEDGLAAFKEEFSRMAGDILIQLGRMIVQQLIFNAISGMFGGGGGLGGKIAAGMNALVYHGGGIAGGPGAGTRQLSAAMIAAAPRYHNGGIGGLAPNEVPAVLEKGEEVLTQDDPRHRDNLGNEKGQGRGAMTVVNAFDAPSFLESALASNLGRDVFVNFVRANSDSIRGVLEG